MRIKFWGVRGSTPTPERRNSRYGGNTPCIEIRLANGTLIVLDCGTGCRALGKQLLREFGEHPICGYVFLTHFHWDHIQGIPFFLPLYRKGNDFLFHSVLRKGQELKQAVEGQMINPYFPVDMTAMGSARHFYELDENPVNVKGAIIRSAPLNHPGECVAYRVDADGASFVLATDTEPGSRYHDRALRDLAQGADILVYDAQYTPEELRGEKKGWGHSSWAEGVRIAQECRIKRLILFHHDPDHDDAFIDGLVEKARQDFPNVSAGAEGTEYHLPQEEDARQVLVTDHERRIDRRYHVELPVRLTWQDMDGTIRTAQGVTRNISKKGIYLIAPREVNLEAPLEVKVVLPDEITHCGDALFGYSVRPVRHEDGNGSLGSHAPSLGIGARFTTQAALAIAG
jgi:phosphoribosyl 1,2-cyclic phosphodiesterase